MRTLLESSWMKFGPADRGSDDWVTGMPPSSIEKHLQGQHWNELSVGEEPGTEVIFYILLPTVSFLLISVLALIVYRRCSREKRGLARFVHLRFQDIEGSGETLSSLTWDSEPWSHGSADPSDGVLLMVYLPPPYEETLTKITRLASISSSKDADLATCVSIEALGSKL